MYLPGYNCQIGMECGFYFILSSFGYFLIVLFEPAISLARFFSLIRILDNFFRTLGCDL